MGLDARQECVVEPAAGQSMAEALRLTKQRMPWMPVIANETELARTRSDAATSIQQGLCSGNGMKSVQLPYEFYPPTGEIRDGINQRLVPQCRCFPGFTGVNCEVKMDNVHHMHKCFNDCNGRGACVHNVCKCQPGTWGIDCSLGGAKSAAATAAAAAAASDGGVAPRPRIYVYDMPPRFTSWLGAFRRGDWTRDHWYGVDVILHQQLLRSKYRTLDPEEADYFFIPLHLSLGFYSHRYYFKHFTTPAAKPLRDAIEYVKSTWPYFGRKGGKDHIMVMTQDQGNRFVRSTVKEAEPLILIHHWGAPKTCIVDHSGQGDHIVGHDITVPPFHGEQVRLNRWLPASIKGGEASARCAAAHAATGGFRSPECSTPAITPTALKKAPTEADFRQLLFFSGKMNLNWGRAYALGVRQAIYRAHRNTSGFLISTFDNGVFEKIPFEKHVENYAASKFCLAPAGYGFSSRQYECVLVGWYAACLLRLPAACRLALDPALPCCVSPMCLRARALAAACRSSSRTTSRWPSRRSCRGGASRCGSTFRTSRSCRSCSNASQPRTSRSCAAVSAASGRVCYGSLPACTLVSRSSTTRRTQSKPPARTTPSRRR